MLVSVGWVGGLGVWKGVAGDGGVAGDAGLEREKQQKMEGRTLLLLRTTLRELS